ncbi:hypothetical protein B0181_05000 [Moraxella caviae]|uniref:Uncharacterized protein n=1 Tax=Moraxella caviae TaxID=34060 RepID=A0A1T0A366_9GAMM|nr:hypothetical protein [Moraxella caviae]OOR90232.1 hypothetical protein B0181_05000 [Moraxella caviae]STZ14547.1 Uncharacterised protein [Moraxella caviae]VEW12552.1 Uncharacterised protein [Moraxella caviae]
MIKLHKPNGHILIDGRHKNLALIETVTRTADQIKDRGWSPVVQFNKIGVAVVPLSNTKDSAIALCNHFVTNNKSGIKLFVINPSGRTFYLFGNPSEAAATGKAGLKIYSDQNGELVFDSRLKYLNVLGVCQQGMRLDANRQYGLLYTSPVPIQYGEQQALGYAYEYDVYNVMFWYNHQGVLTQFWQSDTRHGAHNEAYTSPPLLVDLTGL